MRRALNLHPDWRSTAVTGIEADVARSANDRLALTYLVAGDPSRILLPAHNAPMRTDNLWRRTCFEAFIAAGADAGYLELNFSPSTQWAAYCFTGHRAGMSPADIAAPHIEVNATFERLEISVTLSLTDALPTDVAWRLGLSAVIEQTDGAKSYWALAHPPGQADFHHASSFALDLPPTEFA